MTMDDNDPKMTEASDTKEAASAWTEPPQSGEESAEDTIERLLNAPAEIERLEAEKSDLTDRLLRVAADMDNLRRRTERELADARKYAVQKFAADMLVVGDNLKRALEAIPPERRESDEAFGALVEGVEMTRREMDRLLQRNGITPIAAQGERFDPNRHQAVFEVPNPSVPAGTVVQVMQDGYQIGDRVLRAAMVGVSTGGPRPGETGATGEAENREPAES